MIKIKAIPENPKVGDIEGNTELLTRHLESAKAEGVDLLVFSEMFLSGYPPEDLVMREDFLHEMKRSIDSIIPKTKGISLIFDNFSPRTYYMKFSLKNPIQNNHQISVL